MPVWHTPGKLWCVPTPFLGFPEKFKHIRDIDMDISFKMYILQENTTISKHNYNLNIKKTFLQDG